MGGGSGTNRLLTGAALAGMVVAAGIVGLVVSAHRPGSAPSAPTATPPPVTVPSLITLAGCLGIPSQAPFAPVPTPTPAAPARPVSAFGYSVVDDPATHQVVLVGGIDDYDSTWLWDGQRWTLARPSASPPGRFNAAAAYDPVTRQVMLYGGRLGPGGVVCDTWAWTGTTWVELDKGNSQLPPGELAQMAWDESRQEMVLVARGDTGLETFVWKSGWVRQPHGDLPGGWASGIVFDAASRSLLLLASESQPNTPATWRWNGAAWQALAGPTPASGIASVAVDPVTGHPVLLPELGDSQSSEIVWNWDGAGWRAVPGSTLPSVGDLEIVTDVERGRLLLFGWLTVSTQQAPQALHVWAWTGGGWQRLD